jgi:MurNAc alpha-1-phosphate uridylyltransferase
MILAAGRGERLRPWTDITPKPLLWAGRRRLIEWHLYALAASGVRDVVINVAWLADQFPQILGDGSRYGLRIHWSVEGADGGPALETAGGIRRALDRLGDCFWVVSADVFVPQFVFSGEALGAFAASEHLAELWMVQNPPHHPVGDFAFESGSDRLGPDSEDRSTWSSIGLFRASLFEAVQPGQRLPLRPLLDEAARNGSLVGRRWNGQWIDVGTADRLRQASVSAEAYSTDAPRIPKQGR